MSRPFLVAVALVAASTLAAPAFAASHSRGTFGAIVVQHLDLFEFRQTTATPSTTFTVSWDTLLDVEDARVTLYKPGVWDEICPAPNDCVATIPDRYVIEETRACGPIHTSEGFTRANLPVESYPVTVQGLRGNFAYTLTTSTGTLAFKQGFTAVFVDPVVC